MTCTFLTGTLAPFVLSATTAHAATVSKAGEERAWGVASPYASRQVAPTPTPTPTIDLPAAAVMDHAPLAPSIDMWPSQTPVPDVAAVPVPGLRDSGSSELGVPAGTGREAPVDLEADNVTHDEGTQIVTAHGNVELVQDGRILKADAVSYNLRTEQVRATGNVVLTEVDGTTYFADDVELTDDMKDGFVESLQILLTDGARFTAEEGTRTGGTRLELKRASYTPCEPCKEDPSRPPLWQLRAKKVVHDEAEKKVVYRDAWFEFAGVPLAYTPYFAHPDGSEKQKSGFLTPTVGFDSDLGASYQQEYYWAIAQDKDLTVGAVIPTDVNPVALAEYRQRFDNASFQINGSLTSSERPDSVSGQTVTVDEDVRGHVFGKAQWDMSDTWRSGMRLAAASDDQYLRQYNIDSDDVLENEIFVERFSGRNYTVGRAMAFQDVRVSTRQEDQPAVLPEVISSFYGDPNGMLGGRWNAQLSALGLYRDGNGQDVARSSMELGWQRRYITGFGLVSKLDLFGRGDVYNVQDRDFGLDESNETHTRGFASANLEVSYPFVKRLESSQLTVSPTVSVTAGTNVDYDNDIPNEDSQDFGLDAINIFESNRSAGYDLIEDRSHMTYGVRTGWYGDNGYSAEVFLGQSRRFEDEDNPFNAGSGLSEQESDYVGQVTGRLGPYLNLDYRFQLDNEDFASRRHEVDAYSQLGRLGLGARYFYVSGIEGTDLDETREQLRPYARLRFYDDWYVSGAMRYDFSESDRGLRSASYGIDYQGQCMTFALTAERTLTNDVTGDSDTEIMMRIGLKNLGEFESSGISIGGGSSSDDSRERRSEGLTNN